MTKWATRWLEAAAMREEAWELRCPEIDEPSGTQCTADREPLHVHRWDSRDLPRGVFDS